MIELKSLEQLDKLRAASKILVDVLNNTRTMVEPGITTNRLDDAARSQILEAGAHCAFLGYKGFPKTLCTSVNEEIVHGIPGDRVLKQGDIISIDAGVELNGYFSDAAITVGVGKISNQASMLISVTRQALYDAIDKAVLGNRVSDISCAIQECAEKHKFSVIKEFVGHGIGMNLHEDPQIPNFGQRGMGVRLKQGMVLAIEPMIAAGRSDMEVLPDGWTAVTRDRSLTAHFEHTVAITSRGTEIFTDGIM
jgi:methionyl aminopeptidase